MDLFHLFFKSSVHNTVPLEQSLPLKLFRDNLNHKTRATAGKKRVNFKLKTGDEMSKVDD
jgi:hypothetical protein